MPARAISCGGADGPDPWGVRFDEDLEAWTAPCIMAGINTRVVRRSNALLDHAYGRDFRYQETMSFARGIQGRVTATALTAALGALLLGVVAGPTRALLQRYVLPAVGEGPSAASREAGLFALDLYARAQAKGATVELRGTVAADADPGYKGTALMLGESARCLALDPLASGGGVLTPATAMGTVLIERLRGAGMRFSVH